MTNRRPRRFDIWRHEETGSFCIVLKASGYSPIVWSTGTGLWQSPHTVDSWENGVTGWRFVHACPLLELARAVRKRVRR